MQLHAYPHSIETTLFFQKQYLSASVACLPWISSTFTLAHVRHISVWPWRMTSLPGAAVNVDADKMSRVAGQSSWPRVSAHSLQYRPGLVISLLAAGLFLAAILVYRLTLFFAKEGLSLLEWLGSTTVATQLWDTLHAGAIYTGNSTLAQIVLAYAAFSLMMAFWRFLVRTFFDAVSEPEQKAVLSEAFEYASVSLVTWLVIVERTYSGPMLLYSLWYMGVGAVGSLSLLMRERLRLPSDSAAPSLHLKGNNLHIMIAFLGGLNAALLSGMVAGLASDHQLLVILASDNVVIFAALCHSLVGMLLRALTISSTVQDTASDTETLDTWSAYSDLFLDAGSEILRLAHLGHIWYVSGMSFLSFPDFVLAHMANRIWGRLQNKLMAWKKYRSVQYLLDVGCEDATSKLLEVACKKACVSVMECPVCLDIIAPTAETGIMQAFTQGPAPHRNAGKVLPICGHVFHRRCLRSWICCGHDTCPVCRRGLTASAEKARQKAEEQENARDRARGERNTLSSSASAERNLSGTASEARSIPRGANGGGARAPGPGYRLVDAGHAILGWLLGVPSPTAHVPAPGEDAAVDASALQIMDMFPHLELQQVRRWLAMTRGNTALVVEAALQGRIPSRQPTIRPPAAGVASDDPQAAS